MSTGNDFKGRVALVTGGGRNIGRAIALALAATGAAVIINGRRDQKAVAAVAEDIVAAGGPAVVERCGRLDILINNAAVRPS